MFTAALAELLAVSGSELSEVTDALLVKTDPSASDESRLNATTKPTEAP